MLTSPPGLPVLAYARAFKGRSDHIVEVGGGDRSGVSRALCGYQPAGWFRPRVERSTYPVCVDCRRISRAEQPPLTPESAE